MRVASCWRAGGLLLLLSGACAGDDPDATPVPTVPTATPAAAADGDPTGDGPGPTVPVPAPGAEPGHLSTPGVAVAPTGDLQAVEIALEQIATVDETLAMTHVDGDNHLWVASRQGRIVRVNPSSGEVADTVLDLSADTTGRGEQGLLGIAVDADHLYVNYTDRVGDTRVEAFDLVTGGVDAESRRLLLTQHQPFANHNGGGLAIDRAGRLYIAFGDGGSGGDPLGAGQDPFTWLGSILRIIPTPDGPDPYEIPADNPFADGVDGRPEIYLTGVRNPWRFSFDAATGDLWIADVGQNAFEEVTVLLAANGAGVGANLGWALREGLHEFSGPEPPGHADPVYEYSHRDGISVTGGFVYRGSAIPELHGHYVFGDFRTARLWGLGIDTGEVVFRDLGVEVPGGNLASFGEGPDGELYALSLDGPISKIVPA